MALRSDILLRVAPNGLPDDTEESVLGAEWHQEAIGTLAWSLRVAADRADASWDVTETLGLDGLSHLDGSSYTPRPDVMVLPTALPSKGDASTALAQGGTPLFVAEVASPSTVANDREGKRATYAGAGIAEYLIFDPSGERLGRRGLMVEAWRLPRAGAGRYERWEPEEDGAWRSAALGVRFHVTGLFLLVEDHRGALIPHIVAAMREREEALHLYQLSQKERDEALQAIEVVQRERDRLVQDHFSAIRERDSERIARLQAEQERQQAEQERQRDQERIHALEETLRLLQGQ